MKSNQLFSAFGNIDDRFISEDAEPRGGIVNTKAPRYSAIIKIAAPLAACLIVTVALLWIPMLPVTSPDIPSDSPPTDLPPSVTHKNGLNDEPYATAAPNDTVLFVGLTDGQHSTKVTLGGGAYGELNFIDSGNFNIAMARPYYDPETTYNEKWGLEQVIDYLGADFRPDYLPDDLVEPDEEPFWEVIYNNDGTMVNWSFTFALRYQESYDDEYDPLRRALNIEVAKDGLPFRCALYAVEAETASNIRGNEITVGYCQMGYGPYTVTPHDEPNIPAGYYDVYTAEFMYEGVGYHVQSDNLTQQEFIEVLLSIIK